MVLFNADGKAWLGRRVNTKGPYNWQFPQGGVDKGEDLLAAARRELLEETGVSSVDLLGAINEWITYDFPEGWGGAKAVKGWRGQKQRWFAFRFTGSDDEVDLEHHGEIEFDAWRWADLAEAPGLVVPFKRATYERVVAEFATLA